MGWKRLSKQQGWLIGWLVGWLACWLAGWLAAQAAALQVVSPAM